MSPLLTIKQAAERLNLSVSSLNHLMARGEVSPVRLSDGIVRFELHELERFIRTRRKGTPTKEAMP